MSFKPKYIEYKTKYMHLKQKLNNDRIQIGGCNFTSIFNNGAQDGFTNSCFWISLQQGLNIHNVNLSLKEVRNEFHLRFDERNTMFDTFTQHHAEGLIMFMLKYDLTIFIHHTDANNNICIDTRSTYYNTRVHQYGEGSREIRIASFGLHFQLITNFDAVSPGAKSCEKPNNQLIFHKDTSIAQCC